MPRQSVVLANLILVSLISFSASETLQRTVKRSPAGDALTDPSRCAGKHSGFSYNVDCNKCTCSDSEVPLCTRKSCPPVSEIDQMLQRCVGQPAGFQFDYDCNKCTCSPDGIPGCTRKLCVKIPESAQDPRCDVPENQTVTWKEDCNTCHCVAKKVPACTRMGCPPPPVPTPADTGVHVSLVNRFQSIPAFVSDPRCPEKFLNVTFKDDCNQCFCIGPGMPACTLKGCPSENPIIVKRDTQKLIKAFAAGKQDHASHLPLKSSASDIYPGVWVATAILCAVTAMLARV